MNWNGILGNDRLKQQISSAAAGGRLSHSYLICGPRGSGRHSLATLLACAMECTSEGEKPCLQCNQCRKVLDGNHPDVITVDDPEKKNVQVALARQTQKDLYIRPNEGIRKIYVFPRAQDMRQETQNALLKILEEPPAYGSFLLLSERPESVLPTIRSRCVELNMAPVPWQEAAERLRVQFPQRTEAELRRAYEQGGGYLGQALEFAGENAPTDPRASEFAAAFAAKDRLTMITILCKLEKQKREQLIPVLKTLGEFFGEALAKKNGGRTTTPEAEKLCNTRTAADLLAACETVREATRSADGNVGVGHICGFLTVRLIK